MRGVKKKDDKRLCFSEKLTRFRSRLKDPEWRRHFRLIIAGKALAVSMVVIMILGLPAFLSSLTGSRSYAQAAAAPTTQAAAPAIPPVMPADLSDITKNPTINPINTAWTLIAAFLRSEERV